MKILYFASDNNKTSGAFLCMVQQIIELQRKFNVDSYVVLPYDGDGKDLLVKYKIPWRIIKSKHWIIKKDLIGLKKIITDIKMSVKFLMNLKSIKESRRLIRSFSPDIVHLNTTFCYVGAVAAKQCKIPFVWHLRELVEEGMGQQLWNRKYGYRLMGQSASIICVSNSVKETYKNVLPEKKMEVIYDGVVIDKYPFREKKDNKTIYLVCVGALGDHKGQAAIIQACHLLKERKHIPFKLYIIGRGPNENVYRKMVEDLGLEGFIELSGTKDNVEEYYHKAHFTIINGFKEGFGRVTVEAMLCGSYVIGCDTGGTLELTQGGKYGLIFRHNDVEDLYFKLTYAIENIETLMNERMNCRYYALNNFSSERNAQKIFSLYERIVAK